MRRASREKKLERLSVWGESNSNIQEKRQLEEERGQPSLRQSAGEEAARKSGPCRGKVRPG